jgi:hypothetical protein
MKVIRFISRWTWTLSSAALFAGLAVVAVGHGATGLDIAAVVVLAAVFWAAGINTGAEIIHAALRRRNRRAERESRQAVEKHGGTIGAQVSTWVRPDPHAPNLIREISSTAYISFNQRVKASPFTEIGNLLLQLEGSEPNLDDEQTETALYSDGVWRILKGDFRHDYDQVIAGGLPACIALYNKLKVEHRSNWSTDD